MRNSILIVLAIILALILMVVPGCAREAPKEPPVGNGEPQPDPPPGDEEPPAQTPEPGDNTENPPPEPEVLALDKTDIRTLELEPTAGAFKFHRQFVSYYIPANVEVLRLTDIFGGDYPLPIPDTVLPTREGAYWLRDELYYLSRPGWPSDEPQETVLYVYSTTTKTAEEYLLNFPDSFSPICLFADWNHEVQNAEVIIVGETGSYLFSIATGEMEKVAEFFLAPDILTKAVWKPYRPLLTYSEGNELKLIDVLSGEESILYEAPGVISEFCWGDFDNIALLIGNRVEKIDGSDGRYLDSITVADGAHSLGWVPLVEMICYLTPSEDSLPTMVIADLENNLRYTYPGCNGYTWIYLNYLWTYRESSEQDTTTLVYSRIQWNSNQAKPGKIPESCLDNPRLPDTYAHGNIEKIAGELFAMYLEGLVAEGSITDYVVHSVIFQREELGGFRVSAHYSVQSQDTVAWASGDGELGEDDWINNKSIYIDIFQDGSAFLLGTMSPHP